MGYYWMIRNLSNVFDYRLKMVEYAQRYGKSAAAGEFKTTRKTVRKWVGRFEQNGLEGLKNLSRAPKNIPHKMDLEDEAEIVSIREDHPAWGAYRMKNLYDVSGGLSAIHRVIKQAGLVKRKKMRWRKRKDLSELKKKMALFEKSQVDVKDLSDIYQYWPQMKRFKLPRYEYTLREMSTGAGFLGYADKCNATYASRFGSYVIAHLESYGVDPKKIEIKIQTDNGTEFIGSPRKRLTTRSGFQKVLDKASIEHMQIPPRCSWMQGDVETYHKLIEDEFYDIESYSSHEEFMGKAYAYLLFFNYARKNRNRQSRAPVEILRKRFPNVDEGVLNLPPLRLELLLDRNIYPGYHVPKSPHFTYFNY
jgi:transposase